MRNRSCEFIVGVHPLRIRTKGSGQVFSDDKSYEAMKLREKDFKIMMRDIRATINLAQKGHSSIVEALVNIKKTLRQQSLLLVQTERR